MSAYLQDLAVRLAVGAAALPQDVRTRHADYVKGLQRADGGFAGREGESDLYYTGFALRTLFITGELNGVAAERSAAFLKNRLTSRETVVDMLSLIYGAAMLDMSAGIDVLADCQPTWRDAVADTLEKLRRDDGGYAKANEGRAGSTYQSFLVALCLELIERTVPQPERLTAFILSQRSPSGGFHEIRAAKRAGTNPTAAAISVLTLLHALDNDTARDTIDFLAGMQTDEGGLRANTRIPIADLLSTFTGILTLRDLGGLDAIDRTAALRYIQGLEQPLGGFCGAAWDQDSDVEYTFYGLGCWALLADRE
jgi:geranylgeranyl transferase type-2 subunit beta